MTSPTCGIFIRTYYKDVERLRFTLRSIEKFCTGFSDVVVCCQEESRAAIAPVVADYAFAKLAICPPFSDDFIGQQITKLRAPHFIGTDLIFHVDSDCIFNKPFRPDIYVENGLPILYHREYNFFYENAIYMPWQQVTSTFLLRQVDFEFMALFPLVYPRNLYVELEAWFQRRHAIAYERVPERLKAKHEFSEFNLLGAFSYYHGLDKPFHIHKNWGQASPLHYVTQLAQLGQRDNRTILSEEQDEIDRLLADR